jgi:NitT/TauT family transport system ATP-binding protein
MHVQVHQLCIRYGKNEVLHNVNFTVERGEFLSIVGKSGCGKSTIPPDVGVVFQHYAVFPWLTVRKNVSFGLRHVNGQQREALVARHLKMVGLSDDAHKYPAQLSGGQVQRVALARALAPDPEIILMDEPFGALDLYTREQMQNWLLDIWEKNHKTVIFVTHSIEEAVFLSDRVLILGDGQVQGEVQVPFKRPRGEELKFTGAFGEIKRRIYGLIEHD